MREREKSELSEDSGLSRGCESSGLRRSCLRSRIGREFVLIEEMGKAGDFSPQKEVTPADSLCSDRQ